MAGMKKELLVAFGAQNGTFHDARFESEFANCPIHALAGRLMQIGVAYNTAFTYLAFAHFKLRFD
jgi:hypothetical protein